jgi:hypothetical protein
LWDEASTGQASIWELSSSGIVAGGAANTGNANGSSYTVAAVGNFKG